MEFTEFLEKHTVPYDTDVDLKKKTWIRRGGVARFWLKPTDIRQLELICKYLFSKNIKFEVIGHTSNLYFSNSYNPSIIISTIKVSKYVVGQGEIACDCGVNFSRLSKECIQVGCRGFEGLINLPGTVAAAVYNNSSCYSCGISSLFLRAELLTPCGDIRVVSKDEMSFMVRSSALKRAEIEGVILRVFLAKESCDKSELIRIADRNQKHRKCFQEAPSNNLGSIFPAYVMREFYSNLPLTPSLIHRGINKISSVLGLKPVCLNRLKHWLLLVLLKEAVVIPYVSHHNFGCFVWKDKNADIAFERYRNLVARIAGNTDLEIEIRK